MDVETLTPQVAWVGKALVDVRAADAVALETFGARARKPVIRADARFRLHAEVAILSAIVDGHESAVDKAEALEDGTAAVDQMRRPCASRVALGALVVCWATACLAAALTCAAAATTVEASCWACRDAAAVVGEDGSA